MQERELRAGEWRDPCLPRPGLIDIGPARKATPGDPVSDDRPETIANNKSIVFALKAGTTC